MVQVAVVFGGKSCENEISVLTGVFVLNVLDRTKYKALPVYIHTDGAFYTSGKMFSIGAFRKGDVGDFQRILFEGGRAYAFFGGGKKIKDLGKIDGAINCAHGGLGEGGGVSAVMEMNGIPLASPPVTPSAVFMDKGLTKFVARSLGVPTVDYVQVGEDEYKKRHACVVKKIEAKLAYPVIVKPARLGSSIGITAAKDEEELKKGLELAFELDDRVVVEKFLKGKKDVNCAAYACKGEIFVSEPETAASGDGVYTFEAKYLQRDTLKMRNDGDRVEITGELRERIRAYTKSLYRRMDLRGIVRMDYLVVGDRVFLGEVNTVPGSLAYYLFCERVTDARALFSAVLDEAIERGKEPPKKIVRTGILERERILDKR